MSTQCSSTNSRHLDLAVGPNWADQPLGITSVAGKESIALRDFEGLDLGLFTIEWICRHRFLMSRTLALFGQKWA